jgi:hypothetical protein
MFFFRFRDFCVTVIYCFTESNSSVDDKDGLFAALDDVVSNFPSRLPSFVCGDFNCRVGRHISSDVAGSFRYPGEVRANNNGVRLLDFCCQRRFVLASSFFRKRPCKQWSWRSPNGRYKACLDYVLASAN